MLHPLPPAPYDRADANHDPTRAAKIAHRQPLVTEALESGISPETMADIVRAHAP